MIWFGWVLCHINHCRLFNTKFSLNMYIKYKGFGSVQFNGIQTTVGYLMPHLVNTFIKYIYIRKHILLKTF